MTAPAHIAVSSLCSIVTLSVIDEPVTFLRLLVIAVSSLLPDLDSPSSVLGRILPFSKKINLRFGHRGFIHSLTFLFLFALVTFWIAWLYASALPWLLILYTGFFSHLIADCFTKSGVRLFHPSAALYVFPLNPAFRFNSGDRRFEIPVTIFFTLLCLLYFSRVSSLHGLIPFIRSRTATPAMASSQFTAFTGKKYLADIEIYNKAQRTLIQRQNVEVLYSDEKKLVAVLDGRLRIFEDGESWTIQKVSLRAADQDWLIRKLEGDVSLMNMMTNNFRYAVGRVEFPALLPSLPSLFPESAEASFFTVSASALSLFYCPREIFLGLSESLRSHAAAVEAERITLLKKTIPHRRVALLSKKSSLTKERTRLLSLMNSSPEYIDKLQASDVLKKISSALLDTDLELAVLPSEDDSEIRARLGVLEEEASVLRRPLRADLVLIL